MPKYMSVDLFDAEDEHGWGYSGPVLEWDEGYVEPDSYYLGDEYDPSEGLYD